MTSTRLPGKVLLDLGDRTVLDHHLDRLSTAGLPVVVATTVNASDDPIAALAHNRGVACFRGSETDVLARFHGAAQQHRLDVVVRVTSDCPLVDGAVVRAAADMFAAEQDDGVYLSNTLERTYPRGFDVEVFSARALAAAHASATETSEREHVTPYLYRGEARLRLVTLRRAEDRSSYRVTLDTSEDLSLLRLLVREHDAARRSCDEIIEVLDAHPELVAINAEVEQKKLGD